jgi:hypothetical protein
MGASFGRSAHLREEAANCHEMSSSDGTRRRDPGYGNGQTGRKHCRSTVDAASQKSD